MPRRSLLAAASLLLVATIPPASSAVERVFTAPYADARSYYGYTFYPVPVIDEDVLPPERTFVMEAHEATGDLEAAVALIAPGEGRLPARGDAWAGATIIERFTLEGPARSIELTARYSATASGSASAEPPFSPGIFWVYLDVDISGPSDWAGTYETIVESSVGPAEIVDEARAVTVLLERAGGAPLPPGSYSIAAGALVWVMFGDLIHPPLAAGRVEASAAVTVESLHVLINEP